MKNVVLILLLFTGLAHARQQIGEPIEDILKDKKPAGGACMKDDPLPDFPAPSAALPPPDFTCAIEVGDAARVMARTDSALIDLRAALAFQAYHIPGALNASMADLHAKPYWRNKTVVLVGEGRMYPELFRECVSLKQRGYREVRVLQGGLPAWVVAGKPLAGRVPSAAQLARMPPDELWALTRLATQRVFFDPAQRELQTEISGSVLAEDTDAALLQAVEQDRKQRKREPLQGVIFVSRPGIQDERINALQKALAPLPLRVYADTRTALQHTLKQQAAIAELRGRPARGARCGM